jgi:dTDP-4-dehydrorhamnose 3,5-epimerase
MPLQDRGAIIHFSSMFERIDTAIPGVFVIKPRVHRDQRGFLLETFHEEKFCQLGIADRFVQDVHSQSRRNTLRGLHYQLKHPQAKLCRAIRGEVLDVALDIRTGSPTFGKWISQVLSAENMLQIYIPRGFAHGYVVRSDEAEFLYKCSDFYDSQDEYGIHWADPALHIEWGIDTPTVSEKDASLPRLADQPTVCLPVFEGA